MQAQRGRRQWQQTSGSRRAPMPATGSTARRHKPDYWLVALAVILLAIGLVVVYAISPAMAESSRVDGSYYVQKQLIAIGLSLVAFMITARVPLARWRQLYKPLLVIAAIATLVALVMPVNPHYPAHRWVRLGGFSFQSVELLKFAVLIWLAGFLSTQMNSGRIEDQRTTMRPLMWALVAVFVVVAGIQSDLGSTGVMVVMMGAMAFVAGLPLKKTLAVIGIIGIIGVLAISITPYRRDRLMTFFHPETNCQDSGYQACQAMIAVGSGGMIGLGLGRSVQAYGYLPEPANDSIFAIYAEKFGFIGAVLLLGLFAALFSRIRRIAERAADNFQMLIAVGVLTWLSVQALINIGAMIGLLPLKGITLPFISYGGTSVVFVAAALGLVFQISRYMSFVGRKKLDNRINNGRQPGDNTTDRRRVRGAYHSGSRGRA